MKDSWKLIKAGSRVCFRKAWLQSTGQQTGDVAQARGVVSNINTTIGPAGGIATVDWGQFSEICSPRTAVANLAPVHPTQGVIDDY